MTNKENKKIISFEIPNELQEALRIKAFKERKSISKVIRDILIDNLKEELLEK